MYDRQEKAQPTKKAAQGKPHEVVLLKTRGAAPVIAMPYRARLDVYRSDEAADQADVSKQALMSDGRPLIPAFRI